MIHINGYQIKRLLDFVDSEDEAEITVDYVDHERPDGNSSDGEMMPKGLYAWFTDYPDEGSLWLPETPEEHLASVEPRLQSDAAEKPTPYPGSPGTCNHAAHAAYGWRCCPICSPADAGAEHG